jgi:outer membrane receptor protein involved in Fe transport
MNYNRKFSDKRKSFTSSISTSIGNEKQNTDITSQAYDVLDLKKGNEFLQKTNNYQNTTLTNLKADYVQPISERSELLTGYKGTLRNMDADFQVRDKINGALIQNILASNNFKFNEQIHAGYIQLNSYSGTKDNPKFKYDMGLRGEGVSNDGVVKTTNQTFKNNYFKLFPSAGIAYFKNADEFWKINYSRRINRPGLGQLNPFIDITDSLNPHGGNPDLKPELVNSLELGYSKDLKAFNFYSVVFYRHANNAIRSFTIFKPNGVALIIPVNFGNVSTYGLEQVTTVKASRVYDFNLSFSLFQQKYEGSNVAKDVVNNVFSWYGKWINNFTTWKGGKLQVTAVYNSPLATPQGKRVAIYYTDLGFQQKL